MKFRSTISLLLIAALGVVLVGCGSDADVATPTGESQNNTDSSSKGSDSSSSDSSDSGSSDSLPDINSLTPLIGEECSAAFAAYTAIAVTAFGSPSETEDATRQLEQLKDRVPANIAEDINILAEAFGSISKDGIMAAGEKMSTPEFERASNELDAYFSNGCKDN